MQPVPFWVEPLVESDSYAVTNVYTTTNILDQIVSWTVVQDLTDQLFDSRVIVKRVPETYTNSIFYDGSKATLTSNRVGYVINTWWPPVSYNRAVEESIIGASYAADVAESQFSAEPNGLGETMRVTNSISFKSGDPKAVASVSASSSYEKQMVGIASNSLRFALGGNLYANLDSSAPDTNFVSSSTLNPLFYRIVQTDFNDTNTVYTFTWDDVSTLNNASVQSNLPFYNPYTHTTNMETAVVLNSQGSVNSYVYLDTPALEDGVLYQCWDLTHQLGGYWTEAVNQVWMNVVTAVQHSYGGQAEDGSKSPIDYFYGVSYPTNTKFRAVYSGSNYVKWPVIPADVSIRKIDPKRPIYSVQDHATATYERNTNCWVYGLDLTSCSPWNSVYGGKRAGVLVSPRHIVFANHFPLNNGSTIRFVAMDNQVVTRTVVSQAKVPDIFHPQGIYGGGWTETCDIKVAVLDSDVPSTIGHCKVLPKDFYRWLPSLGGIPVVWLDRMDVAWNARVDDYENGLEWSTSMISIEGNAAIQYPYYMAVDQDSGNPIITFIGTTPVLLATFMSSNGSYDGYPRFYDALNDAMTTLGGGYQLDPVDLEGLGYFEYSTIGKE
jgi:hypothetical protein